MVMKIVDEIVTTTEIDEIDEDRLGQDRREAEAAIEEDRHVIEKDHEIARREEGEIQIARETDREGENRMTISMRKWNASDKKIND